MSCLSCHDAHRDDFGEAAFYEAKCLSCHSSRPRSVKEGARAANGANSVAGGKISVCPVNSSSKCLECHMPKVPMPALHRDLTDHFIRVHDRGGKK
jgi:hypothetical protein